MPVRMERVEASQTAGRMSKGVVHPAAERRPATVVGINWMEAVLHTTNIQSPSEATPGVRRAMSLDASRPRGVAAFPSPRRFAEIFAETASMTSLSSAKEGKRRRSNGRNNRESRAARPQRRMTSMTPVHRQSSPAMERQSSTPCAAPETAAAPTASPFPVRRPQTSEITIIPTQSADIATSVHILSGDGYENWTQLMTSDEK